MLTNKTSEEATGNCLSVKDNIIILSKRMIRRKGIFGRRARTFKVGHRFGFSARTADEADANCTGDKPRPSDRDVAPISSCKPAFNRLTKEEYESC